MRIRHYLLGPLSQFPDGDRFQPKCSFKCELPAGDYLIGDTLLLKSSPGSQLPGCFEEPKMPGAFYAQAPAVSGDGTYTDSLGKNNTVSVGLLGIIDARLVVDRDQGCKIHASHHRLYPAHLFENRHQFSAPVRFTYAEGVFVVTCLEFVLTIDTNRLTERNTRRIVKCVICS